ncbi:MAG: outer membrane beta-barrel protein [Rhodobacteraceae bacterium]|nr:outer membrane beta-barrel protein [Paracoccaceae bacterium]
MKFLYFVGFLVSSISIPLYAGEHDSLAIAAPGVVLAFDPQTNWDGVYIGGSFARIDGSQTYALGPEFDLSGTMSSGFAGFNLQNGSFVYGAEAAYSVGSVQQECCDIYQFSDMLDLKARVGIGVGDAVVFGVAGWSMATWEDGGGPDLATSGINLGVGVDYLLNDRFFVGAEYLFRDLNEDATAEFNAPLKSVQIRAGLKF